MVGSSMLCFHLIPALYITAVDLKLVTIHVFTSVGRLLNDTQGAVIQNTINAYTKVPNHICNVFTFVGDITVAIIRGSVQILQDFIIQLVMAPANVLQAFGSFLYKLVILPVQAYPFIPISAHIGFAVVVIMGAVYWKFSIFTLFRKLPALVRLIYFALGKVFVVVRNFKRITEETIRSGGSSYSKSPRKDTIALCVICQDATVSIISMPCKHVCLCFSCVKTLVDIDNRCPLCRGVVTQYEKVYIPL